MHFNKRAIEKKLIKHMDNVYEPHSSYSLSLFLSTWISSLCLVKLNSLSRAPGGVHMFSWVFGLVKNRRTLILFRQNQSSFKNLWRVLLHFSTLWGFLSDSCITYRWSQPLEFFLATLVISFLDYLGEQNEILYGPRVIKIQIK